MKNFLLFLAFSAVLCLKEAPNSGFLAKPKGVNPDAVKSPGGFNNIAPDATHIKTPIYATPKARVEMSVETASVVQRTKQIGTSVVPNSQVAFDAAGRAFDRPVLGQMPIKPTTTQIEPVIKVRSVDIDLSSGRELSTPAVNAKHLHGYIQ